LSTVRRRDPAALEFVDVDGAPGTEIAEQVVLDGGAQDVGAAAARREEGGQPQEPPDLDRGSIAREGVDAQQRQQAAAPAVAAAGLVLARIVVLALPAIEQRQDA